MPLERATDSLILQRLGRVSKSVHLQVQISKVFAVKSSECPQSDHPTVYLHVGQQMLEWIASQIWHCLGYSIDEKDAFVSTIFEPFPFQFLEVLSADPAIFCKDPSIPKPTVSSTSIDVPLCRWLLCLSLFRACSMANNCRVQGWDYVFPRRVLFRTTQGYIAFRKTTVLVRAAKSR